MRILWGTGIGSKKASGRLKFYKEEQAVGNGKFTTVENEIKRLEIAKESVKSSLISLSEKAKKDMGEEEGKIFEIHIMLLEDDDLYGTIIEEIESKKTAEQAVSEASEKYAIMLKSLNDEYLSERAKDIRDIASQLISVLTKKQKNKIINTSPYILVAEDLTPSQTASLDKDKILGFITFYGTPSSHTSILARAMGIPAIVGVGEIDLKYEDEYCLLDSESGEIIISPTVNEIAIFKEKEREQSRIAKEHESYLKELINKPAISKSGHRVLIYANIGSEKEAEGALLNGAEGIGLLRSEMLYLSLDRYPTEDELYQAYKEAVTEMKGRCVIIRTLDIGADKQIPYFNIPKEENPALGYRGVRICLDREDVFKIQDRKSVV